MNEPREIGELRTSGLLWLINTTVFHPRGFALGLHFDELSNVTGWSLLGDGTEPWTMGDGHDIDELFAATNATFDACRPNGGQP